MTGQIADLPTTASAEDLIEQAGSTGWAFFDGPTTDQKESEKRAQASTGQRMAQIAAILWGTSPEFRELLGYLAKGTLHRTMFLSPLNLPMEQAYAYGQFREGQNAAVFAMFKLIAEGQQLALKPRGE